MDLLGGYGSGSDGEEEERDEGRPAAAASAGVSGRAAASAALGRLPDAGACPAAPHRDLAVVSLPSVMPREAPLNAQPLARAHARACSIRRACFQPRCLLAGSRRRTSSSPLAAVLAASSAAGHRARARQSIGAASRR